MDTVLQPGPAESTVPPASLAFPRFLLREAGGALGDLGTFVPLAVGMVQVAGLDAGTLLVTAGVVNIWSGWQFRIPMAVQPMKAIAALAIAGALSGTQAMAAGFFVGVAMLALGVFGLVRSLARIVPLAVLRGLQLTIAGELLLRGAQRVFVGLAWRPTSAPDDMVALGLIAGAAAIVWLLRRRLEWVSIGLLGVAVGLAAWHEPLLLRVGRIEVWRPHWMTFNLLDLDAVWQGGLPQLALTLLNSVLAVASLAGQLYPQHAAKVTPTRVALSVGVMNVLVCPLGGMPLCHGSGGLAGQHKMGARSGLSVILLGLVKLVLGLLLGGVALAWMRAFPPPILGLFLLLAGWSLAEASRAWDTRPGTAVSLLMLVTYYATASLPLAFGTGWIVWCRVQRGQPRVASLPAAVCPQPWTGTAA